MKIASPIIWSLFVVSTASAQWIAAPPPIRANPGGYYGDLVSRTRNLSTYLEPERGTTAHECTHAINSQLRQGRENVNCFYMLQGNAAEAIEPPITLAQVAAAVPQNERGPSFQLYLVSQRRYFNRQPLYVFDEWAAYLNGCTVNAVEKRPGDYRSDIVRVCEFSRYAAALMRLLPFGYDDTPLWEIFDYQLKRTNELLEFGKRNQWIR